MIDHVVESLGGEPIDMSDYRGKALLLVNVASRCGYTKQYAGLQKLHETYASRGLVVMGFPCNDFGAQEPGSAEEIRGFCTTNYGVTFPMAGKVAIVGAAKSPLYRTLTEDTGEGVRGEVKWNFTKFLVDPEGAVVARFEPGVDPMSKELTGAVEAALP
jgi:glutathione peroxidase